MKPFDLLADYLGAQYNPYQKIHYELTLAHVDALEQLYYPRLVQPRLIMLLQHVNPASVHKKVRRPFNSKVRQA